MLIKHLSRSDYHLWEHYVERSPNPTFYHRVEWKEVIEKSFGHKTYYLMAIDEDVVVGILPMVHMKSLLFGSIFCSMPFLNFGGICADNENAEKALFKEARSILYKMKGDYLEMRHLKKSSLDIPYTTHKVSMTINLDPDPEVLWESFKSKHRTNIRRAAKNDLEIKFGGNEFLEDFYNILSIGWRDLGTPFYQLSFFQNTLSAFKDSVEICIVIFQEKPIAIAFNGFFKDTVEGMWMYSIREFSKLQTTYFLYWKMIERYCNKGYKLFHLGRSSSESGGIFYKKKWNAELKQLYWEYALNRSNKIPELNVDNPKYQKAINLWRKLPVQVTQYLGPHIAKNIP